jgi:hypothetical protein
MTEHQLHRQVAAYLAAALRPPTAWTSIDAGAGKLTRFSATSAKARGVKAGWPDILVIHPQPIGCGLGCILVGIELKIRKGRLSAEQLEVHSSLTMAGARVAVCRSVEDVEALLIRNGVPLRARLMAGGGIMREAA